MGGKTDVVKGRIKKAAGALMHTDYLSPTIRQLRDQQVRFAPYEKQITKQIAQETGRSEETVRSTLRHFNLAHPDLAIFPYNDGPLWTESIVTWQLRALPARARPGVA